MLRLALLINMMLGAVGPFLMVNGMCYRLSIRSKPSGIETAEMGMGHDSLMGPAVMRCWVMVLLLL